MGEAVISGSLLLLLYLGDGSRERHELRQGTRGAMLSVDKNCVGKCS